MQVKVYLSDWFYNMGIVGFLRIVDKAKVNWVRIKDNYIEFDSNNLKDFHHYYFDYFFDIYNVYNNISNKMLETFGKMKKHSRDEERKLFDKESNSIKNYLKAQINKVKKIDLETYDKLNSLYKDIGNVKCYKDIKFLDEIYGEITKLFKNEKINNRLTLDSFKYVLNNNYFGQPNFLNVSKTKLEYIEQETVMYKNYISNIVEIGFINDILNDKYTTEEIKQYIEYSEKQLQSKVTSKIFGKILKDIEKDKSIDFIKKYIKENVLGYCSMCNSENVHIQMYTEENFIPLAISSKNMKNFFWNQEINLPICDICKLMLFCIPAGATSISKVEKENLNGKYVYKERSIYSFLNYDTTVQDLLKYNNNFSVYSKKDRTHETIYQEIIKDIVQEKKQISNWQLDNIFFVEFEAKYGEYSRIQYFNIKKYVANFFANYADYTISRIVDNKYKLQIMDYIFKNMDASRIINERLREDMRIRVNNKNTNSYDSLMAIKARMIINILKKGDFSVGKEIKNKNNDIDKLYDSGKSIYWTLKTKNEENKLDSYTYKLLNCVKVGNKDEFMNTIIKLHMFVGRNIPKVFLDVMKEEELDFETIGHSFIAGLICSKIKE